MKPGIPQDGVPARRMLAEVAHELRSPLGGVEALSELLLRTELTAEQARLVEGLRAAAEHLRSVASSVLEATSQEVPEPEIREGEVDLAKLVSSIAVAAQARAAIRGLTFDVQRPADMPRRVLGDGRRIRQMVENLIDNAFKVTSEGSVTLAVEHVDTRGRFTALRFAVTDTGPGFGPEAQDRLFKAFGKLDNGVPGTGLGLHLVNRFARLMGGEAGCSAEEGVGSCFWFTLRLPVVDAVQLPDSVDQTTTASIQRLPILVVDDNATNRLILQAILEHFGYRCVEAASGEEALEIVAAQPLAAVMLDHTLTGMNGVETLRAIRRMDGDAAQVLVIPVSGRVSNEDRRAFAEAGADGFVEKPVSARTVMEALRRAGADGRRDLSAA